VGIENIICSDCGNFTYKDRRVDEEKGKTTPEKYGFCEAYQTKTSADTFYGLCPSAVRIPVEVYTPKLVKKLARKRTTKPSRK
tara:strand:+ start:128 stop:376 length:249 start_codon:yes stop_codon:yes gene_type:complete